MTKRRIEITAICRRRTILSAGDTMTDGFDSLTNEPGLDPTTNSYRRNNHDNQDQNNCAPHDAGVDIWFILSTIKLSTIRQRITHEPQQQASDTLCQQRLQDD